MKEKIKWSTNTSQEPKLLGITQVAKRLGFSRHHVWNLIDRSEMPAVKTGNKWFIPTVFILKYEELIEQHSKEVLKKYKGDSS